MNFQRIICAALFTAACLSADSLKYTYDPAGRLATVTSASGTVVTYSYDAAGNLIRRSVSGSAALATVSAASYSGLSVAPGSLVSAFGQKLAILPATAPTLPLPTTLGGTTIDVKDSTGAHSAAQLVAVYPTQANFVIPAATATGPAVITVTAGDGTVTTGAVTIESTAPGLFTANASGQGLAAALRLRVDASGNQTTSGIAQFDASGNLVPVPIDLGASTDQIYLILFGTGIRGVSALSKVQVTAGQQALPVIFAGDQQQFPGLDQVNIGPLPRALAGQGQVAIQLTVDGKRANVVTAVFK